MTQYECLMKRLELLNKIRKNTATQLIFLARYEVRGLRRLLKERAKYLHALTMLNARMSTCSGEPDTEEICALRARIKTKEQEVLAYQEQTMQKAREERDKAADSLRRIRQYKHLRDGYKPQCGYNGGRRFNKKV